MRSTITLLSLVLLISLTSCDEPSTKSSEKIVSDYDYSGVVKEVIQTSNYTYCFVADDKDGYWIAVAKMNINVSQNLYFNQGLEMIDFHSKELDRTFASVFFVQKASTEPNSNTGQQQMAQQQMSQKPMKPEIVKKDYNVDKADGGITISELYANKEKYAGKKVKIRGKVTKFNSAIMGKNWAHIQDGTDYDGNFDLTVTTAESVNKDAVVTFEGIIAIDKDFGAGYSYSVIMEDAHIVN